MDSRQHMAVEIVNEALIQVGQPEPHQGVRGPRK
jgi:hypothetical protein